MDFACCGSCGFLETRAGWEESGGCLGCGDANPRKLDYFPTPVWLMVDLMQEAYHLGPEVHQADDDPALGSHEFAVVIYFATLGEVLFNGFLLELLCAHNVPEDVAAGILKAHSSALGRERLFKALTGLKFKAAVQEASAETELDLAAAREFYSKVTHVRNGIVHAAATWEVPDGLAARCIEETWALVNLFAVLHNRHIHTKYKPPDRVFRPK